MKMLESFREKTVAVLTQDLPRTLRGRLLDFDERYILVEEQHMEGQAQRLFAIPHERVSSITMDLKKE